MPETIQQKISKRPTTNNIDMSKVFQIESSNNPLAWNKGEDARGLGQIRPIVLKEWNNFNPKTQHVGDELFNPEVNKKISNWYMNKRIPQMLRHFGIQDTVRNRIIAYNAGIATLTQGREIPSITKRYLKKFDNKEKAK